MTLVALFSGSRDWPEAWAPMVQNVVMQLPPGSIVRHGDCKTGVDALVDRFAEARGDLVIKRHPALWKAHGAAAGPMRNKYMVSLGADFAFFFSFNRSPGTEGCYELSKAAGIRCAMHRVELIF